MAADSRRYIRRNRKMLLFGGIVCALCRFARAHDAIDADQRANAGEQVEGEGGVVFEAEIEDRPEQLAKDDGELEHALVLKIEKERKGDGGKDGQPAQQSQLVEGDGDRDLQGDKTVFDGPGEVAF